MRTLKSTICLLSLLLAMGCQNETVLDEQVENLKFEIPNPDGIYVMDGANSDMPFQEITNDENFTSYEDVTNRNPNTHLYGNYLGYTPTSSNDNRFYKSMEITFNALENSQGTNWNATFKRTWGDNGEFTWKFKASAEQLLTVGNDAVYCGVVFQESGPRPFDIVGARIWFRVKDDDVNSDKYFDGMFFNSTGTTPCFFFSHTGPAAILWDIVTPIRDVERNNDFIELD